MTEEITRSSSDDVWWLYDQRFWEIFSRQLGPMGAYEKEMVAALSKKKGVSEERIRRQLKAYYMAEFDAETQPGSPNTIN
jgi:hypothetical protein